MDIKFSTKQTPLVVAGGANVNAVYGPWDSLDDANSALNTIYTSKNIITGEESLDIPTGTTVGIYKDGTNNKEVKEYWYINDALILKSFDDNYYNLEITDISGYNVENISLEDGISPDIIKIKKIDNSKSLNKEIYDGTLKYSIDGGNLYTFTSPLTISSFNITNSLTIYWYYGSEVLAQKVLKRTTGANIQLDFYYSYAKSELPELGYYSIPDVEDSTYQTYSWNPSYGDIIWQSLSTGILETTPYEFKISRKRINGHWEAATGPIISARWGVDGISTYDRQAIYTLTDSYDLTKFSSENDKFTGHQTQLSALPDANDAVNYINSHVSSNIYYSEDNKPSPDPYHKYLWCRTREAYSGDDGSQQWGAFSKATLYSNFAEDGKDADDIEYIFHRTTDMQISSAAVSELSTTITNGTELLTFDDWIAAGNSSIYWTDDAKGVGDDDGNFYKVEWCSKRKITTENGVKKYNEWITPFKWAVYGDTGNDGAGVEYIYLLTESKDTVPEILTSDVDSSGKSFQNDEYLPKSLINGEYSYWTDNYTLVSHAMPYSWYAYRKGSEGNWGNFSTPKIWFEWTANYELFIDNDVTQVPASLDGYSSKAIMSATMTGVTLKRGNQVIDSSTYTIKCSDDTVEYKYDEQYGKYYLDDTGINFNGSALSFTLQAIDNTDGTVLAQKDQTISLNLTGDTYNLQIIPNSRIWYGGTNYSVSDYSVSVYRISSTGVKSKVSNLDISGYELRCNFDSLGSEIQVIDQFDENPDRFETTRGYGEDLYFYLYNKSTGTLLDFETVDTVDYSTIKGKDSSGYILSLQEDSTNIAYKRKKDTTYLSNKLINKLSVYYETTLYKITTISLADECYKSKDSSTNTYNLTYANTVEDDEYEDLVLKYTINDDGTVDINISATDIDGDLSIPITVTFNGKDGSEMKLTKVWEVALGDKSSDTYSLYLTPQTIMCYDNATSFDVESISAQIINDTTGTDVTSSNDESYVLKCEFVKSSGSTTYEEKTADPTFNIDQFFNQCTYGDGAKFRFTLFIKDSITNTNTKKATLEIDVIYQPTEVQNLFVIDLNNPIVKIPMGATLDSIISATSGTAFVYTNNKTVHPYTKGENFGQYTYIMTTPSSYYPNLIYEESINEASQNYYFSEGLDTSKEKTYTVPITFTIYLESTYNNDISTFLSSNPTLICLIVKNVVIKISNETTYQFKLSPGAYSLSYGVTPLIVNDLSIKIFKYVPNESPKELTYDEIITDLLKLSAETSLSGSTKLIDFSTYFDENLKLKTNPFSNSELSSSTKYISFDLLTSNNEWLDSDNISINHDGRPGDDGDSKSYIYGLWLNEKDIVYDETLKNYIRGNDITREKLIELSKEVDSKIAEYSLNEILSAEDILNEVESNDAWYIYKDVSTNQWNYTTESDVIDSLDADSCFVFKITDNPQGVSSTTPYEFLSVATLSKNSLLGTSSVSDWSKFTIYSAYGDNGTDGPGLEYIYIACISLKSSKSNSNWSLTKLTKYDINSSSLLMYGTEGLEELDPNYHYGTTNFLEDDYTGGTYWVDEIPELTYLNPNLYMCQRKKKDGTWGKFSEPKLWDTYDKGVDFSIDNDQIILDDNSISSVLTESSKTNFTVNIEGLDRVSSKIEWDDADIKPTLKDNVISFKKGDFSGTILVSFSEYLTDKIVIDPDNTATSENPTQIAFKYADGIENLDLGSLGQISYSLNWNEEFEITKTQKLAVYNFSAGETYKMIISPNVLNADMASGESEYTVSLENLEIHINLVGNKSVTDILKSTSSLKDGDTLTSVYSALKLYVGNSDISNYVLYSSKNACFYINSNAFSSKIDTTSLTPLVFNLKLSIDGLEVIVDSETISFGRKGEPGSFSDASLLAYVIIPNASEVIFDELNNTFNVDYISARCVKYYTNETISGYGASKNSGYTVIYHAPQVSGNNKLIAYTLNLVTNGLELCYANGKSTTVLEALSTETLYNQYNTIYIDTIATSDLDGLTFEGCKPNVTTKGSQISIHFKTDSVYYDISIEDVNGSEVYMLLLKYSYGIAYTVPSELYIKPLSGTVSNKSFCNTLTVEAFLYDTNNNKTTLTITPGTEYYSINLGTYKSLSASISYIRVNLKDKNDKTLAYKTIETKLDNESNKIVAKYELRDYDDDSNYYASLTIDGVNILDDDYLVHAIDNGFPPLLKVEDNSEVPYIKNAENLIITVIDPTLTKIENAVKAFYTQSELTTSNDSFSYLNEFTDSKYIIVFLTKSNKSGLSNLWLNTFMSYGADSSIASSRDACYFALICANKLSQGLAIFKRSDSPDINLSALYTYNGLSVNSVSSITMNLTNDFDIVNVDDSNLTKARTIQTYVELYQGITKLSNPTSVSITIDNTTISTSYGSSGLAKYFKYTYSSSSGLLTINVLAGYTFTSDILKCSISFTDTFGNTQTCTLQIKKYKGNTIKQLSVSDTSISVNENNVCTPSSITCSIYDSSVSGIISPTYANSAGNVWYLFNGDSITLYKNTAVTIKYSSSYIKFYLLSSSVSSFDNDLVIDIETIPIIKDGKTGRNGENGSPGVCVRTFFGIDSDKIYRDDSSISASDKLTYDGTSWVNDTTDTVLYKDYVAFINDSGDFVPFVCTKTVYIYSTISITSDNYTNYISGGSKSGTGIGIAIDGSEPTFSDAFVSVENLGNSFFLTISALSGDIRQLKSSTLRVQGLLLMHENTTDGTLGAIQGGINGMVEECNNVSPDLSFWSGGTGEKTSDANPLLNNNYDATFAVTKEGTLYCKNGIFGGMSVPDLTTIDISDISSVKNYCSAFTDDEHPFVLGNCLTYHNDGSDSGITGTIASTVKFNNFTASDISNCYDQKNNKVTFKDGSNCTLTVPIDAYYYNNGVTYNTYPIQGIYNLEKYGDYLVLNFSKTSDSVLPFLIDLPSYGCGVYRTSTGYNEENELSNVEYSIKIGTNDYTSAYYAYSTDAWALNRNMYRICLPLYTTTGEDSSSRDNKGSLIGNLLNDGTLVLTKVNEANDLNVEGNFIDKTTQYKQYCNKFVGLKFTLLVIGENQKVYIRGVLGNSNIDVSYDEGGQSCALIEEYNTKDYPFYVESLGVDSIKTIGNQKGTDNTTINSTLFTFECKRLDNNLLSSGDSIVYWELTDYVSLISISERGLYQANNYTPLNNILYTAINYSS